MKRRDFLKVAGATATGLVAGDAEAGSEDHPNLLVIHTDEHNLRTLGCYRDIMPPDQAFVWGRDAVVETPYIDWIAQNGALCSSFYATTPVCSPSRGSLMSGCYPQNTPVVKNNIQMSEDVVTFAEILRRQGYATGYAGKWHLDGPPKPGWEPKLEFGYEDNTYMFNRGHWKQLEDTPNGPRVKARNKKGRPTYHVKGADEESFTTDFLADRCVDFIRKHREEPFCYMLSIPDPHGPNSVRPPYDSMFDDIDFKAPRTMHAEVDDLPAWGNRKVSKLRDRRMADYFGMVKCIDDNVGKILNALRSLRLMGNTIVVFTADHGDLCGEHGRHNKGNPFEMSARIPFVIYYPEKISAGTRVGEALGCVDFLPTVLSLMGFSTAGKEEGRDASELLMTGRAPSGWKDIGFFRSTGFGGPGSWLGAYTSRYKLVYDGRGEPWLFDLQEDPDELVNFFKNPDYKDIVHDLSRELLAYCHEHGDPYLEVENIKKNLETAARG